MDMRKMMKQAQKMQLELARAQEEIKDFTYTATAGGGMVEVVAKGDNTIESIAINPRGGRSRRRRDAARHGACRGERRPCGRFRAKRGAP